MADNVQVRISFDGIGNTLRGMLDRGNLVRGWLNRYAYPAIIAVQRQRWMSEGASEGAGWAPLNPTYARYKLRKFADFPGGGRKMLIATGKLVDGMTGDNMADHYKLVTTTKLEVGTLVSYAKYVNEKRNIVDLSEATIEKLSKSLNDYLTGKK